MGNKRKREVSDERIQRKIRKLEAKLKKRKRIIVYSSEDDFAEANNTRESALDPVSTCSRAERITSSTRHAPSPEHCPDMSSVLPQEIALSPTNIPVQEETENIILDDETLELLGEAPEPDTVYGKSVHKDIAARWREILKKGLTKEVKDRLLKDYQIPANCELLAPPLLNPEAKAALTDSFVKRDTSMVNRQKHLSVAVAALTHVIDKLISIREYQHMKNDFLKPISDACRILCDMHHYESNTRKKFVISSINSELKDALAHSSTDKFLFGEDMSDNLKKARTVQKSGESLKNNQKPVNQRNNVPNKPNSVRNKVNFKTLHQKRPIAGRVLTGPRQQAGYPRSRPRERSPVPSTSRAPARPLPTSHNLSRR